MTYFALLKGVNVSGHRIIKMAELKVIFENMGYKNVRTYIQSGNVVFESAKVKNESIANKLEAGLKEALGYAVSVVVRTKLEIESIIAGYPFNKVKGHEDFKRDVAFLSAIPEKSAVKELETLSTPDELFKVIGNNVYTIRNKTFPDALIGKGVLEKKLKVIATVRNWNTVNKILTI